MARRITKCLPKFVQTDYASSSIKMATVEKDIPTMQRFLDVSRVLQSGGWQV